MISGNEVLDSYYVYDVVISNIEINANRQGWGFVLCKSLDPYTNSSGIVG